jgi:hypothetical protein
MQSITSDTMDRIEDTVTSGITSKLATLRERLGKRLQDLEITDGMDALIIKPRRYLGLDSLDRF